jgi:DNA-binding beta-propeller fold protein YncE
VNARFGFGDYQYELVRDWPKFPKAVIASDIATDSKGLAYVPARDTDSNGAQNLRSGSIQIFDRNGTFMRSFGEDLCIIPHGIWINSNDEIFHTDMKEQTVRKFAPSGELLMTLGTPGELGPEGSPFRGPTRAVQSQSGDIYVSDGYEQNRIHRFTPEGELTLSWGKGDPVYYQEHTLGNVTGVAGEGPGEFNLPHDVTVDRNGRVYIMDRSNNRCQVFDSEGAYITEWADIRGPNDAVIDENDVMHVVEAPGTVLVITLEGEVLGRWGRHGEGIGEFRGYPHGVWMDPNGDIYVAEVGAENALQKFARV